MIYLVGTKKDLTLDTLTNPGLNNDTDNFAQTPRAVDPAEVQHLISKYPNGE